MRVLSIILILLFSVQLNAQRIKYKELFPTIWSSQEETAIMMLKEYLQSEPEHPNANYMLAGIYASRYLTSDVLTEYEKAMANADQVQMRILKCKTLIDEREVRRNDEYYINENNESMDWLEIDSTLTIIYNSAIEFMEKAPPVYENFTKSVLFYDQTIKAYADICGKYNSLDNLLMYFDSDLEGQLSDLKRTYDSTLFYFNAYKSLIAEYPIGYSQEITIQPIERFRLQGLVARVDFLSDDISIWDYGKWTDEIQKTVETNVVSLRSRLLENDKKIDGVLRAEIDSDKGYVSMVDKGLVFNLEKLDYQSLPVSLINYKDYLTALRFDESKKRYYDTASLDASSKYIYYSEVINEIRTADTLLNIVKNRNTEVKRGKHEDFLQKRYGGTSGLEQYIGQQVKRNGDRFETYVQGLRNIIVENNQAESVADSGVYLTYNRKKYPTWITGISNELAKGVFYTTHKRLNPDGSTYLGGVYKAKADNLVSFVFRMKGGKVEWMKEYDISIDGVNSDANNRLGALELTKEGVLFVIRSEHLNSEMSMNSFYYLNEKGAEKFVKQLEEISEFPRIVKYFESQNRFLLVFSGEDQLNSDKEEKTKIVAFNAIGDQLWVQEYVINGSFVDLIGVREGYFVIHNFKSYKNSEGGVLNAANGALSIKIDDRGKILQEKVIDSPSPFFISHIVKASDSNINLLGYKGKISDYTFSGLKFDRNLIHVILDNYNQVVSSSIN